MYDLRNNRIRESERRNANVLQCLSENRDATIVFRLPKWMREKIEASGKSFADYIIAKLGEDMFKPNEGIDQEAWQKEVAEW